MRLRTRFFLLLTLLTPYISEADVPTSNSHDQKAVIDTAQATAARELGKPVQHLRLFFFKMAQGIEIGNFGGVGESQGSGRDQSQRPNGAPAGGQAG